MDNHYSSFNSLLELLTAFNFAFVISDGFNEALKKKVVASFDLIESSLKKVGKEIEGHEKSVSKLEPIKNSEIDSGADIENAIRTINKLNTSYKAVSENVTATIKSHSIENNGFSHLCLFNAFFCMFILLITPYYDDFDYKGEFNQTLFIYSLICLLYVSVRTFSSISEYVRNIIAEEGYLNSSSWFAGITALIFLCFYVNHRWVNYTYQGSIDTLHCNLLFMLIVPSFHFIIYYFYAIFVSRKVSAGLNTSINDVKAEVNREYKSVLADVLKWHQKAQEYKIKPQESKPEVNSSRS